MQFSRGAAPDFEIRLPANHDLVLATPMLRWITIPAAQGGAPLAGLSLFKAIRAFLGRCSFSKDPQHSVVFERTPFLQIDLVDAAWIRVLQEYLDSELPRLLQESYASSLSAFDEVMKSFTPTNPANLVLLGTDLLLRESFDAPAVGAPPPRRGGRGAGPPPPAPAVAAVPGPPELLFLNLCTLNLLEDSEAPTLPLLPLSRLAGMLGPFSTRDKRLQAVSTIQLTGSLIRQQLISRFGCQADGAMAVNLKDMILDTYLPSSFCAAVASEEELRREARDACSYRRSTQGRIGVEISRISYLRSSTPNLSTQIVDRCTSALEAHGLLLRLGGAFAKVSASQPLADFIPSLEATIADRVSTIEDCMSRPNSTIHQAVEELIKEAGIGELSAKDRDGSSSDADQIPRGDAIEAALRAEPFKRVANSLAVSDTSTKIGRMDAIAAGFDGDCVLAVRTLCRPIKSNALTARVPALATLNDMHSHVHAYLTWILTADPTTGNTPRHLQGYSIVGTLGPDERPIGKGREFLTSLLDFDLANVDWVYSPGGLIAYKVFADAGTHFRPGPLDLGGGSSAANFENDVHPLDIYTRPEVVEELGEFIHRILTALGCSSQNQQNVNQRGVTFRQWTSTYLEHLKRGSKLSTLEERYEHLDHCHSLYTKALARAGAFLRGEVYSLLPAQRNINRGVLRVDEEPYISLLERQQAHDKVIALRSELSGFLMRPSDTAIQARAFQTLRRSTNPALQSQAKQLEEDQRKDKKRKFSAADTSNSEKKNASGAASGSAQNSRPQPAGPPTPGSQTAAWMWIVPDKELFVSGWVWNVAELAKLAKVPVASKCWPWLLSTRRDANKPSICDRWSKSGHTSPNDVAHVLPSALDLRRLGADAKYCRPPTAKEREVQQAKLEKAGLGNRGRGKGKGGGRLPGKGARGGGQPPGVGTDSVA